MSLPAVLGGLDAWALSLILVSAGFYGSALVAAGSVPLRLVFREIPAPGPVILARQLVFAAWLGIFLVLLQWPLQGAFLGGGTVASAFDPFLLALVFESAQGNRIVLAAFGLLLLQVALLDRSRIGLAALALGLLGAVFVLLAFVQVGHTRDEPRWLFAGLLLLHLAAVAFWIAALVPLHGVVSRSNDDRGTARLLARFGQVAVGFVGLLLAAGAVLAWMLLGGPQPLLTTGYGQVLILKLTLVSALLGFAALNKWRLVPALERGDQTARARLRWSIRVEIVLVVGVLLATALLTTTTPPGR